MHISFTIQNDFLSCSTQSPWVSNRLTCITLGIADLLRNILQRFEEDFGQSKAFRTNVVPSHILQYHFGKPVFVKGFSRWLKPWLRKAFDSPCLVPTRPYSSRRLNGLCLWNVALSICADDQASKSELIDWNFIKRKRLSYPECRELWGTKRMVRGTSYC